MSNEQEIQIDLTPEFHKNLRTLAKRFPSIHSDVESLTEILNSGQTPGDRISGVSDTYIVFKVRVRNSNLQKGKSSGYRVIYQIESESSLLLLTIYSKLDRPDISADEILDLLKAFYSA